MLPPQKPQPISAAARNAEALFEAKNVTEIRQIEARTRQDIEEKNLQLRQLVGDSYRDLIACTDNIIDISTKCHNILSNISVIQESFSTLAVSVTSSSGSGADGKESARKHQELHAVGSRVRYVMDSPEIIWGCLDGQQHLEAARRLLRVHEVYEQLQTVFKADVAAKFPLLSHQWPLVVKFRGHILAAAVSTLTSEPELSGQQAVEAIAAIAMLQGLNSAAALQQFLSARQQWAQQLLESAVVANEQVQQQPGRLLAQLVQQVQACIAQVGELFMSTPRSGAAATALAADRSSQPQAMSLLQLSLQEDEADASELFFGSVAGPLESSNSPEAVAWRQKCNNTIQQLAPLQRSQVEQSCTAWLASVAALCAERGLTLLQHCSTADSLLQTELAVQQVMIDWRLGPLEEGPSSERPGAAAAGVADDLQAADQDQDRPGGPLGRLGSSAAAVPSSKLGSAAGPPAGAGRPGSDWELTCGAVFGRQVDLWQVLLHDPFLQRCKQLIQAAVSQACSSINGPLVAALEAAAQHEPEAAGQLQPGQWPMVPNPPPLGAAELDRTYSLARAHSGVWQATAARSLSLRGSGSLASALSGHLGPGGDDAAAFRTEPYAIRQLFDSQLHALLQAVLLLSASSPEQEAAGSQWRGSNSSSSHSLTRESRTSSLARTVSVPSQGAGTPSNPTVEASATVAAAACLAAGKQRGPQLEQFTQQQCVEHVQQLAQQLQQQLQQLPAPVEGLQGASTTEQALLIARVCHVIAHNSTMLPALLGPPEGWSAASKAGPDAAVSTSSAASSAGVPSFLAQGIGSLGPAAAALLRKHHPGLSSQGSSAAAVAAAAQLTMLQDQLRGIANAGHARWASWVAHSLSGSLLTALQGDELLHSSITPKSWVEIRLQTEGGELGAAELLDALGDAPAAGEMSFALPACPSSSVLQMLSLACWETRRAGEQLISLDALQLLEWELHGAAVCALQKMCSTPTSAAAGGEMSEAPCTVSEKGVLQLLFDQRLLADVLAGGRPVAVSAGADTSLGAASGLPPGSGSGLTVAGGAGGLGSSLVQDVAGALASRKSQLTSLEQQLQDLLDPIDWATYEPYLWGNVQRYYQRTSVLLGSLGQLHRPYADTARSGPSAAADINTLNVLPVAPRLQYLPISMPTAQLHGSAAARNKMNLATNGSMGSTAAAVVAAALAGGAAGPGAAGAGGAAAVGGLMVVSGGNAGAADLAAQYVIPELGSSMDSTTKSTPYASRTEAAAAAAASTAASIGASLHLSADTAAAAGASALSALQARLQGSSIGAFGSLLGDRAAEVTAGLGDLLPAAGLGGGLLSSFARRDGAPAAGPAANRK